MTEVLTAQILTYKTGRPVLLGGSNTFNKDGIPSVGKAPAIKATNIIFNIEDSYKVTVLNRHIIKLTDLRRRS